MNPHHKTRILFENHFQMNHREIKLTAKKLMQMENVIVVYHVSKVPQPGVKKKKENKLCAGINDSGHLCPKK